MIPKRLEVFGPKGGLVDLNGGVPERLDVFGLKGGLGDLC